MDNTQRNFDIETTTTNRKGWSKVVTDIYRNFPDGKRVCVFSVGSETANDNRTVILDVLNTLLEDVNAHFK